MKYLFLLLSFIFSTVQSSAQHFISGQLRDAESKAEIPYASIALLTAKDSIFIEGTTSDENSFFKMKISPPYDFVVRIQMLGYETKEIIVNEKQSNLGIILLLPTFHQLNEIEVTAERSILETDLGKYVLHVGKDLINGGGDLSDVLENLPSVDVSAEGAINVRGSSNIVIYVNGKETKRDGRSLTDIPASMIQKVELITNPSAKYDAEGVAGILNIVYRKNREKGFNLQTTADIAAPLRWQLGALSNYKGENFNILFNANYRKSRSDNSYYSTRQDFNTGIVYKNNQISQSIFPTTSGNVGLEWNIDSTSQWSMEASYFRWEGEEKVQFSNQVGADQPIFLNNRFTEFEDEFETQMNYRKEFQRDDHQLDFSFSYGGEEETNISRYNLDRKDLSKTTLQNFIRLSDTKEKQRLLESKVDYQVPFVSFGRLEMGIETNLIQYDILQQLESENPDFQLANNDFEVKQWKHSAYLMFLKDWEKVEVGIGARLENFQSDAIQYQLDSAFQTQALNLFPSFQLLYELNSTQKVGLTYSKRIQRPGFFDLNPFIYYDDPLNISTGNPFLKPELADALELNHEWTLSNFQLTTTLFRRETKNVIQRVIQQQGQISIASLANFARSKHEGVEATASFDPFTFWRINTQFSFFRQSFESDNEEIILQNNQTTWSIRLEQTFKFKKDWRIQLMGRYRAPRIGPQSIQLEQYYFNVGIQKSYLQDRLNLSLSITDIFRTRLFQTIYLGEDFRLEKTWQYQFQRLRFGVKYRF